MNTNSFEKIINEAWNNKGQVNSKSSREILNSINKTIDLLDFELTLFLLSQASLIIFSKVLVFIMTPYLN